jgi:exopolysaccharide biosynthesis polyprenyl glycosylphosphotransferase
MAGIDSSMSIVQVIKARRFAPSVLETHVDLSAYGHARVAHGIARWERRYRLKLVAADSVSAGAALATGLWVRRAFLGQEASLWGSAAAMQSTFLVIGVAWLIVLANRGAYAVRYFGAGSDEYRAVTRASVTLVGLIAFASFALQLEFSRGVLLVSVPVLVGGTLTGRYVLRRRLAATRDEGGCLRPAVVVGEGRAVVDIARRIADDPRTTGLEVVGVCIENLGDADLVAEALPDLSVLGGEVETLDAVDEVGAEVVAVASSPSMSGDALRRLGWALEQRDVDLLIAPGVVEVAGPRLSLRRASGLPMLHVERPVSSGAYYSLKQAMDRMIACIALLVLGPLLVGIAVVIRLDSPGPGLFRQQRVGEAGRPFSIFKFRTMVQDADAQVASLASRSDGNGVLFKMRRDPRVTRVGALLRRYSLDELPQLINVARGEMSLVGPRPPLPREVDGYESDAVRRLRVRPGMTGLWQVSGRSDLSWVDSLRLDLWYVDNWSLALDAQIIVRTFRAVLNGSGAY